MWIDIRVKLLHFFKRNKKIVFILICVLVIIFIINSLLKNYEPEVELQTTYEPHTSVMDTSSSVPKNVSDSIEDRIDKYVTYCNNAEWDKAYNMLSTACKEYSFENSIDNYMEYVYTKMDTPKKYAIQDFSNDGNIYIYQIKYTDDLLATGLTNSTYQFTEEKMIFKKQKDGSIDMSVGNFIDFEDIKNISENEYLKVDVKSVVKYYSTEIYTLKLTNRSDYTIVISDGNENDEIFLTLNSGDTRSRNDVEEIVLKPNKSLNISFGFQKFYDNSDDSKNITFGAIRVMEKYSGSNVAKEVIQSEIQNAVAKFSVSIPVK